MERGNFQISNSGGINEKFWTTEVYRKVGFWDGQKMQKHNIQRKKEKALNGKKKKNPFFLWQLLFALLSKSIRTHKGLKVQEES